MSGAMLTFEIAIADAGLPKQAEMTFAPGEMRSAQMCHALRRLGSKFESFGRIYHARAKIHWHEAKVAGLVDAHNENKHGDLESILVNERACVRKKWTRCWQLRTVGRRDLAESENSPAPIMARNGLILSEMSGSRSG